MKPSGQSRAGVAVSKVLTSDMGICSSSSSFEFPRAAWQVTGATGGTPLLEALPCHRVLACTAPQVSRRMVSHPLLPCHWLQSSLVCGKECHSPIKPKLLFIVHYCHHSGCSSWDTSQAMVVMSNKCMLFFLVLKLFQQNWKYFIWSVCDQSQPGSAQLQLGSGHNGGSCCSHLFPALVLMPCAGFGGSASARSKLRGYLRC